MHVQSTILEDLAVVLGVAALISVIFRRLRQPVVLGYLLAGLVVGPYLPVPLSADPSRIHALSELGVTLVMFSVGLELSLRKLLRVVPAAGLTGVIQISTLLWLGYLVGQAFGWSTRESVYTGAMIAISSTMIVVRVFAEQRISGRLHQLVLGVLVLQDLVAVLLLALLSALSGSRAEPGGVLATTATQLALFLAAIIAVGFLVIPRVIRWVVGLQSAETLLVASVGICFMMSVLAHAVGYSVALGAFLAGALVAESGAAQEVERSIRPLRDLFAAVFFVAVGMAVDPAQVAAHWPAVLALVAAVLFGQVLSVSLGGFLSGYGVRTSIQAGMSLAHIGELSFVIAGIGAQSGTVRDFLYPVAVSVCVVTSFATPWLVRLSGPLSEAIDHRLPPRMQTFMSLYGAWLEQVRNARDPSARGIAHYVRLLVLDAFVLGAIVIGTAVQMPNVAGRVENRFGIDAELATLLLMGAAVALSTPFAVGIVRLSKALGARLAARALPKAGSSSHDPAAVPRRVLVVTLQLAVVLVVGAPLVAATQPFVPPLYGFGLLVVLLALLGIAFWRGTIDLQEHVRAGAYMVAEALARQSREAPISLAQVHPLLPGLGPLTPVRLEHGHAAVGRTLADIDLRARSGASVIAIGRGAEGLVRPTGREALQEGDVLALAGTHEAIAAAMRVLEGEARD